MAQSGKDALIGTRIREYEILEIIGKGGMGAVYRARHVYLDEERAIKVIKAQLAEDKEFVDRFIREARILIRLRHPNLVQLHEFGSLGDDAFFMVLELIRGESVLQRIHRLTRIPVDQSLRIIREAALGLQNAHHKGIIHRDLSPDNLMLVKDDRGEEITKVLDFGIAKPLFESTQNVTMTNMFIGKPEYCSPEQCGILEDGEVIDARSDIYSLTVTLYHMIAGKLPLYSRTPQGYLLKHANEIPKQLSTHLPPGTVPKELDLLVEKAFSKKREDRQKSMDDFVSELDAIPMKTAPTTPALVKASVFNVQRGDLFAHRYLVDDKLGEGGFGAVYKARDTILNVLVALKILRMGFVEDPIALERFKREVILARKVSHPNVCRIYDIGESNGLHYVSMEYLEGRTLADILHDERRLPPEVGLPIMRDVLLALEEAHRVGITHRDLKPQNIMVDADMRARIMDFGISISSDVHRVTQVGVSIGTPYYMAPEQFEGKNIDQRSDIYSIGIIMYEMFAGELPFKADTPMAIVFAHLKQTPRKPSEIVSTIFPALESIILKTLEKEAGNRYQNVKSLLRDLQPLIPSQTTTTGSTSIPDREQVAHKLIVERNYSKAIRILNAWVTNDPGNPKWKKLLGVAKLEKLKRDLRRVRGLLKKGNTMGAQLLLEKIQRFHAGDERIITQVRKLEKLVQQNKQRVMGTDLQLAEDALIKKDWPTAFQILEKLLNLLPEEPKLLALLEKARHLQEQHGASLDAVVQEHQQSFSRLAAEGDDARVLEGSGKILDSLASFLKENPGFAPAVELQKRITAFLEIQAEGEKIAAQLKDVASALQSTDFNLAYATLQRLITQVTDASFRKDLTNFATLIGRLSLAFSDRKYSEVPPIINALLKDDPRGWLTPYERILEDIISTARRKESDDLAFQKALREAKDASKNKEWERAIVFWKRALEILPQDSEAQSALAAIEQKLKVEQQIIRDLTPEINRVESLIQSKQWVEAGRMLYQVAGRIDPAFRLDTFSRKISELQKTIDSESKREAEAKAYSETIEKGKALFAQKRWEEAIESWKGALRIVPKDVNAGQLILSAEKLLREEAEMKDQLRGILQSSRDRLASAQFLEALTLLEANRRLLSNDYRIERESQEYLALLSQAQKGAEEKARGDREAAITSDVAQITALLEAKKLNEALQRTEHLAEREPALDVAQALKGKIELALKARQVQQEKFSAAFERGKQFYDQSLWNDAIGAWRSAEDWAEDEAKLQKWIALAETRLREETEAARQREEMLKVRVTEAAGRSIQALCDERYADLDANLESLRTAAQESEFSKEAARISENLRSIADALRSQKWEHAQTAISEFPSLSILATPSKSLLENLERKVGERKRKTTEWLALVGEGKDHLSAKRWVEASRCFEKAGDFGIADAPAQAFAEEARKRVQRQNYLQDRLLSAHAEARKDAKAKRWQNIVDRCAPILQEDFSDFPSLAPDVEKLRSVLNGALESRIGETLKQGNKMLQSGRLEEAKSFFEKVLSWESQNDEAKRALGSMEETRQKLELQKQHELQKQQELQRKRELQKEQDLQKKQGLQKVSAPVATSVPEKVVGVIRPSSRVSIFKWLSIPAFLLIGLTAWYSFHRGSVPPNEMTVQPAPSKVEPMPMNTRPKPAVNPPAIVQNPPVVAATETVVINALPWARIRITPASSDTDLPELNSQELTTPCVLSLRDGSYTLQITNDLLQKPLIKDIQVRAGQANEFTIDAYGGYTVESILAQVHPGK